ncbi:MAG: alpha/beta hydrolase [Dehalococcoidia bacterium]
MTMLDAWPHHYAETNGVRLHYVEAGPEDGRLVVLLHGFPEFWYSWRHQIEALSAAGYRVVAPDMRGYNLSEKPAKGYDLPNLTADIAGLVRGLGRERFVIAGHDWGGGVTWAFASWYPEMTEAVIVVNAPHSGPFARAIRRPRQALRSWYMGFFQLPFIPEMAMRRGNYRSVDRMFTGLSDAGSISAEEVRAFKDALAQPGALTASINYYRAVFRHGVSQMIRRKSEKWPVIESPTLLIWGVDDAFLGVETFEGIERWAPNIRIELIEGAGHWVNQERPDEVNRLMLDFLEGLAHTQ